MAPRRDLFNFDLERMRGAVEGGTVRFPGGLNREQRRALLRNHLASADQRKPDQ